MPRVADAVAQDHQELLALYARYQAESGNAEERAKLANEFRWKLAIHSLAEELIIDPASERHLGPEWAAKDRAEHQAIKFDLEQLDQQQEGSDGFVTVIRKLHQNILSHFSEEESELPKLDEKLSDEESMALAKQFNRTKLYLPAHGSNLPYASTTALFNAPREKVRTEFEALPDLGINM